MAGSYTRQLFALASAIGLKFGSVQHGSQPSHRRQLFLQAGFRGEHTLAAFLGFKILGAALLAAGGNLLARPRPSHRDRSLAVLVIVTVALLGWYLPDIILRLRIAHRKELLLDGFPDALDLMVVCVEAGMGLDAAVTRVGEEMRLSSPIVSEEFRLLSLELRAGKMRRDALHALAMRTGLEEIQRLREPAHPDRPLRHERGAGAARARGFRADQAGAAGGGDCRASSPSSSSCR